MKSIEDRIKKEDFRKAALEIVRREALRFMKKYNTIDDFCPNEATDHVLDGCSLCKTLFPSIKKYITSARSNPCPCHHLNKLYVDRMIRRLLK